ncbi:unnamed protein product [Allacma fusca]|uniref:SHSP domain-containing protein n=1 Tax=Allacma fusca TaxID=39272 RepID=A0A8J2NYD8_9HEXA|nr:unnamed protein product [Allacma fusca]
MDCLFIEKTIVTKMYRNCGRLVVPVNRLLTAAPGKYQQPLRTFFGRRYPRNELSVIEDTMKDMDRHFQRMEREFDQRFRGFSRPWAVQLRPWIESELFSEGKPSKYTLNVNVGEQFKPEDVKISLKDRLLTIEAKGEVVSEDGSSRVYQEISRRFTLPDNIDVKELKSVLSPEGILRIEAPLPQEGAVKVEPKEIPISHQEAPVAAESKN